MSSGLRDFSANGGARELTTMPRAQLPVRQAHQNKLVRASHQVSRLFVLHRRHFNLAFAAILVAALCAGAFYGRGGIVSAGTTLGHVLSGRFAAAGVGVSQISISGQALTQEKHIAEALAIDPQSTIFEFDPIAARARLLELPAIAEASVRKIYPSRLVVEIEEIEPIARWRVDGLTYFIDAGGAQLAVANPADTTLPIVIGDGAADDAAAIISVLARYPELMVDLAALSRIADRRWDFIYDTGLRIKMPERGVAQALNFLEQEQARIQILDRDLTVIDLRVDGLMAVEVAQRDEDDA